MCFIFWRWDLLAPVKNSLTKKKKKIIIIERFSITCEGQDYAKKEREKEDWTENNYEKEGRKEGKSDRYVEKETHWKIEQYKTEACLISSVIEEHD